MGKDRSEWADGGYCVYVDWEISCCGFSAVLEMTILAVATFAHRELGFIDAI